MNFYLIKRLFTKKDELPSSYFIDPSSMCNLNCPLCPTGLKLTKCRKIMSFSLYKKIIDQIPRKKYIGLYNWGEPFLNPNIFEMIKYAKKFSHFVEIHSNFNLQVRSNFYKKLIESNLDKLVLSIDGTSQKIYSKYRKGGNYNLVLKNLTTLSKVRESYRITEPEIVWKFMVNKYNESQIETARHKALELNINFITSTIGLSDDLPDRTLPTTITQRKKYWLPKNKKYIRSQYIGKYHLPLHAEKCKFLFDSIFIDPQGKVFPCCELSDQNYAFGDLSKASLIDIWNNDIYQYSRSLFDQKKSHEIQTICADCHNYKKI